MSSQTTITIEAATDDNRKPTILTVVTTNDESPSRITEGRVQALEFPGDPDKVHHTEEKVSKEAHPANKAAIVEQIGARKRPRKDAGLLKAGAVQQEPMFSYVSAILHGDQALGQTDRVRETSMGSETKIPIDGVATRQKIDVVEEVDINDGKSKDVTTGIPYQAHYVAINIPQQCPIDGPAWLMEECKGMKKDYFMSGTAETIQAKRDHHIRRRTAYPPMLSLSEVNGVRCRPSIGGPVAYGLFRDAERGLPVTDPAWK